MLDLESGSGSGMSNATYATLGVQNMGDLPQCHSSLAERKHRVPEKCLDHFQWLSAFTRGRCTSKCYSSRKLRTGNSAGDTAK
jgi:hypothetical protein